MTKLITGETELYDLKNDPHEWHNLSHKEEYAQVVRRLESYLSFQYPKLNAAGWHEAEMVPSQISGDYLKRENCQFYKSSESASGGKVVCADLRAGKNSYLDFVVDLPSAGKYELGVELSCQASGILSVASVVDDRKQSDEGFYFHNIKEIIKTPKNRYNVFKNDHVFDRPGHVLMRISTMAQKQRIEIDRLLIRLK